MSDTHGTNGPDQHGSTQAAADNHGSADDHGSTDDHADGHGHDDHGGETLGPIDWRMWGAGVVGVVSALIVVAGFVAATDFSFAA
ncbi:MAG: hypothetical protein MUQ32_01640 [Chloroflexi bacterium]|nr:hypothetical protein [Chloroflexota bacterium]